MKDEDGSVSVIFLNESPHRELYKTLCPIFFTGTSHVMHTSQVAGIDIHYGSRRWNRRRSGGNCEHQYFFNHKFFVTLHGFRKGLVDPSTDDQCRFTIGNPTIATVNDVVGYPGGNEEELQTEQKARYLIPSHASPSTTKCKDRYPVYQTKAARGECTNNPSWMIVTAASPATTRRGTVPCSMRRYLRCA